MSSRTEKNSRKYIGLSLSTVMTKRLPTVKRNERASAIQEFKRASLAMVAEFEAE
jgi:hypothetical protein